MRLPVQGAGFQLWVYLDSCVNLDKTLVYFTSTENRNTPIKLFHIENTTGRIFLFFLKEEKREKKHEIDEKWKDYWTIDWRLKEWKRNESKRRKRNERKTQTFYVYDSPDTKKVQKPRPESQWRSGLPYVLALWPDPNSLLPLGPQSPHL